MYGLVQGVGFRWWARNQAERLGLSGTVANEEDGSVVIIATGDDPALRSFRTLIERGPEAARVDRIEATDVDAPVTTGFRIIR